MERVHAYPCCVGNCHRNRHKRKLCSHHYGKYIRNNQEMKLANKKWKETEKRVASGIQNDCLRGEIKSSLNQDIDEDVEDDADNKGNKDKIDESKDSNLPNQDEFKTYLEFLESSQ
jgi:hypothetical protein